MARHAAGTSIADGRARRDVPGLRAGPAHPGAAAGRDCGATRAGGAANRTGRRACARRRRSSRARRDPRRRRRRAALLRGRREPNRCATRRRWRDCRSPIRWPRRAGTTRSSWPTGSSRPARSTTGRSWRTTASRRALAGRRCLDAACSNGFWAFELERRGGKVVALDIPSIADWDFPAGTPPLGAHRSRRARRGGIRRSRIGRWALGGARAPQPLRDGPARPRHVRLRPHGRRAAAPAQPTRCAAASAIARRRRAARRVITDVFDPALRRHGVALPRGLREPDLVDAEPRLPCAARPRRRLSHRRRDRRPTPSPAAPAGVP